MENQTISKAHNNARGGLQRFDNDQEQGHNAMEQKKMTEKRRMGKREGSASGMR
jgi:hypothetical protein